MASSSTTLQVEALSTVHAEFADVDKNVLKRKLADCEKDLAWTKNVLLRTENGRTLDGYDIVRQSEDGIKELDKIQDKLRNRSNQGQALSKIDMRQLMQWLQEAKHCFLENKRTMVGSEDEDEDEQDTEDEQ